MMKIGLQVHIWHAFIVSLLLSITSKFSIVHFIHGHRIIYHQMLISQETFYQFDYLVNIMFVTLHQSIVHVHIDFFHPK